MTDDAWNQEDAWAEQGMRREDPSRADDWMADVASGNAHVMQGYAVSPPQSGLGIASLVLSVIAGLLIAATMVWSAVLVAGNPNIPEDDPRIVGVGCGIILGILLAGLAGVLGLVGLFQPDRGKTCAVLGLLIGGVEVLGAVGIVVLGLMMGR